MARKTIVVCDVCGAELPGRHAVLKIQHEDSRVANTIADLCDTCVMGVRERLPGARQEARRGRKPAAREA